MRDKCAVHKTNSAWGNLKRQWLSTIAQKLSLHQHDHQPRGATKKEIRRRKLGTMRLRVNQPTHRKKQCACGTNEPTHQRLDHLARAHRSGDESKPVQRTAARTKFS